MAWKHTHSEQYKQQKIRYRHKHYHRIWSKATLSRHRKKGHVTEISTSELTKIAKNAHVCAYCGCELDWSTYKDGKPVPNSPSLDRIGNGLIIRQNNIQIICLQCNTTKFNRTHDDFILYCKKVVEMSS